MKKNIYSFAAILALLSISCNKASTATASTSSDFTTLEQTVVIDFVNNVAVAQYSSLVNASVTLNGSITILNSTTTDANLQTAQASWKNMRIVWEQCEGFLFGPIEDNDYDPNTDTWPTDYTQMDSLLASKNSLLLADMQNLPQSLRGYHPIEYLIFGANGARTAAQLTARQKQYLVSLSADILYNNVQPLYQSWTGAPTNYANQVLTAGAGSVKFTKKQDLYLAIVGSMSDICNEVGGGKMKDPFDAKDPKITESPYSGNTLIDFKNNMIGVQNVYLGLSGGKGLKDLVAAKNKSLDNQIQAQLTSAINSFSAITESYEKAIVNQRVQVQATMTQLATLQGLMDNELAAFVKLNIQN